MSNFKLFSMALIMIMLSSVKNTKAQLPSSDPAYTLVWADSFNYSGPQIDTSKWRQKWGAPGDSVAKNNYDTTQLWPIAYNKWYKPVTPAPIIPADYPPDTTNCKVNGGNLTLYTRKETYSGNCWTWPVCPPNSVCNVPGYPCTNGSCWHAQYKQFAWTSGYLLSKYKFKYGYFEIKFKLPADPPAGKNYRCGPAFWLWNADCNTVPWSEIDIFEIKGSNNTYTDNVHYSHSPATCTTGYPLQNHYFTYSIELQPSTWYTAGCLWTDKEIVFYLNGGIIDRLNNPKVKPDSLLEMPIFVDLGGPNGNFNQVFDANSADYTYQVDYVKVWQITNDCNTAKTYCNNYNPAISKLYQSVTMDGTTCVDAITNTNYTSIYGTNYVLLDQGFSIDNNSTVVIDVQNCNGSMSSFTPAAGPPPASFIPKYTSPPSQ